MPDELSDFAKQLIKRCPQLINLFASKINSMIYNWDDDPDRQHQIPIDVDIQHVGYTAEQCGYDK